MHQSNRMSFEEAIAWTKEHYKETLAYLSVTDTSEFEAYYAASGMTYDQARESYVASRKQMEE